MSRRSVDRKAVGQGARPKESYRPPRLHAKEPGIFEGSAGRFRRSEPNQVWSRGTGDVSMTAHPRNHVVVAWEVPKPALCADCAGVSYPAARVPTRGSYTVIRGSVGGERSEFQRVTALRHLAEHSAGGRLAALNTRWAPESIGTRLESGNHETRMVHEWCFSTTAEGQSSTYNPDVVHDGRIFGREGNQNSMMRTGIG